MEETTSSDCLMGLRDQPISSKDIESLGLGTYAKGLSDFILRCDTPMTIALQGDWGSGKTSLMNLIKAQVENSTDVQGTVWFNTWQFSQFAQADNLPVTLISHLVKELGSDDGRKKQVKETLGKVARFALVAGAGFLGQGEAVQNAMSSVDGEQQSDICSAIADLKTQLENVVKGRLGGNTGARIVFFIDDLDRLVPARAVEVLEVLKLFLDIPGCVFVLACDYQVVIQGLKQKFGIGESDLRGRSFFDKIIQLPFNMPVHQYQVDEYFRCLLGKLGIPYADRDVASYAELVANSVGMNPRSIKRLLNSLLLLRLVIQGNSDVMRELRDLQQGQWERTLFGILCMQNEFPALFQFLSRQGLDQKTLDLLRNETSIRSEPSLEELRRDLDLAGDDRLATRASAFVNAFVDALQLDGDRRLSGREIQIAGSLFTFSNITSAGGSRIERPSTTEDRFLSQCAGEEVEYYLTVFGFLQANGIQYRMGATGFSIQDRAGTSIMFCYPTQCSRNIELLTKNLDGKLEALQAFAASAGIAASDVGAAKALRLRPSDVAVTDLCELVRRLAS